MNKITILLFLFAFAFFASCDARGSNNANPCENGVVINGIRWATRNVAAPGTFAENPQDFGMLFQWNRKKGWNTIDEEVEGWDSTPDLGTAWYAENNPCPPGWRVPTKEDFSSLFHGTFDYVIDDWGAWFFRNFSNLWEDYDFSQNWTYNWQDTGASGMIFGRAPNQIFLPITPIRGYDGYLIILEGCEEYEAEYWGTYWTGSHAVREDDDGWDGSWRSVQRYYQAYSFDFKRGAFLMISNAYRVAAFPIRCVVVE